MNDVYVSMRERNLYWTMPGRVKVGDRVRFRRQDGQEVEDIVRQLFMQQVILAPYAPNEERPAAVLTEHSWCFLEDILGVVNNDPTV